MAQVSDEFVTESSPVVSHLLNENNLAVFAGLVMSSVKTLKTCKYLTMLVTLSFEHFYLLMLWYRVKTTEKNSSVFSVVQMRHMPLTVGWAVKLTLVKSFHFFTVGC